MATSGTGPPHRSWIAFSWRRELLRFRIVRGRTCAFRAVISAAQQCSLSLCPLLMNKLCSAITANPASYFLFSLVYWSIFIYICMFSAFINYLSG